jgi:hypothetical protein
MLHRNIPWFLLEGHKDTKHHNAYAQENSSKNEKAEVNFNITQVK